ncbi:D-3-phosphoglycerate dehydrogenase [Maritimibacter alkaliphilus HTCC2654]|uniref:Predicted dehydrogenase n=1 Tax=Maritimibacter alkaliphilus HTCC2654 TaxID=314271 RepID=A3VMJ3_9RHOB|nr:2-hydroxyacid dehydrogenase [Maritimibacter alkaliphilus]EAQ10547.1 Predicted dehydrogenase [Rhodobacterales bacterium HTCC2654] [Maritimibacter alkaliphilus HTCC2654]TYP78400.1 D-3-phosphoglycerate dehydrogenase [Maritimibacter alkaliphilus HTCC2654]
MAPKIYIAQDPVLEDVLDIAAEKLLALGWTVVRGPEITPGVPLRLSADQRQALIEDVDIIVASSRSRLSAKDLDASPRLRALVFPTIGVDAVDLEACAARGLIVANGATPENFLAMSEATVMLMLVLLYRLHESERLLRENAGRPQQMYARMVRGRTIGLIGSGRIGAGVIERLLAFEPAQILVHDPFLTPDTAPAGVRLVERDALLTTSDVVSLHVPLNAQTRGMIAEAELRAMKTNAVLINTSRGGLIDEDALVRVMTAGHLAGAGLDVTETEPLPADHPLRGLDRVILTPHILGHTIDLYTVMPDVLVENATRIMKGDLPTYVRNPDVVERWRQKLNDLN